MDEVSQFMLTIKSSTSVLIDYVKRREVAFIAYLILLVLC